MAAIGSWLPGPTVALCGGREFHLGVILDLCHMKTGDNRAGPLAPAFDDLRVRPLRVGAEPARLVFATKVTTQPAQADRLKRDHSLEDRILPLSRRRSPNDVSDHPISALVLRLPDGTESYMCRVCQDCSNR